MCYHGSNSNKKAFFFYYLWICFKNIDSTWPHLRHFVFSSFNYIAASNNSLERWPFSEFLVNFIFDCLMYIYIWFITLWMLKYVASGLILINLKSRFSSIIICLLCPYSIFMSAWPYSAITIVRMCSRR